MKRIIAVAVAAAACAMSITTLAADADKGKAAYNAKGCIGCHGVGGQSVIAANPVLKGRDAQYLVDALTAFSNGSRQNPTMNAMAGLLTEAQINDVAAYLSAQQ